MAAKTHIKKGDEVIVLAGREKGKTGTVSRILTGGGRAVVEKVNMVKRSTRPTKDNPSGGIVDKEASLHLSNLMLFDSDAAAPFKAASRFEGGKKIRVNRKTGKPA